MQFMMTYSFKIDTYEQTVSRFLETGAPAPEGVNQTGRWHAAAGRCGFILFETDDVTAIYTYASQWQDLIDLQVYPVLGDEAAAGVLSKLR